MHPIFKPKKNLYKTIPLANLHPHPAQPPSRTSDKNIQGLMSTIMSTGRVDPPVVIPIPGRPGHYWVCNGNRRVKILRKTGVNEIECIVDAPNTDVTQAWVDSNSGTLDVSGAQVFAAWGRTTNDTDRQMFIQSLTRSRSVLANQIVRLYELLGDKMATVLAQSEDFAPNVVTRLDDILRWGEKFDVREVSTRQFQKSIIMWVYTNKAYKEVGRVKDWIDTPVVGPTLFAALIDCIKNDKKFRVADHLQVTAVPITAGPTRPHSQSHTQTLALFTDLK